MENMTHKQIHFSNNSIDSLIIEASKNYKFFEKIKIQKIRGTWEIGKPRRNIPSLKSKQDLIS